MATEYELLVLVGLPICVLLVHFLLRKYSPLILWPLMVAVIAVAVSLAVFWSGGQATWPAVSIVVGGSLLIMVWTLRRRFLARRLSLQAFLGIPIYLLSLATLLAVGVGLGLVTP